MLVLPELLVPLRTIARGSAAYVSSACGKPFSFCGISALSVPIMAPLKGRVNPAISAAAASIEEAEDALILLDVAAIFAVVAGNAECLHHRGLLAPDTGACDSGTRR